MNTPAEPSTPDEGTRQSECPYVTGTVTRYCTLTPFTLTDAEREAVEVAAEAYSSDHGERFAAILRGLLERTMPARDETRPKPPANPERDVR
jgi:hypothetical protein